MTCENCQKPEELCVCEAIEPLRNRVFVVILQHPQEKREDLGTAQIAHRQLENSVVRTGLSWPNLKAILGREVDMKRWGVLFLGSRKDLDAVVAEGEDLVAVGRKGERLPDQKKVLRGLEGIILLDGTWSQAKTLWWRNAWLLKVQRLLLNPGVRSKYGKLRKEPRREALSTLEAAAYTLSRLEGKPELYDRITKPFDCLVEKVGKRKAA